MPLFSTVLNPDLAWLVLRLGIGIVFLYHGLPKIKNPQMMANVMPKNAVLLLGLVEAISGAALILGLWVQLAALLLAIVMTGAWYYKMAKWHVPFFAMDKTGWEFDFVLLAGNLAIVLGGGGSITAL